MCFLHNFIVEVFDYDDNQILIIYYLNFHKSPKNVVTGRTS